jgi:uncharacterized protein (TIGR03437 family)
VRSAAIFWLLAGICYCQINAPENAADEQAGGYTTGVAPGSLTVATFSCCGFDTVPSPISASFRPVGQSAAVSAPVVSTSPGSATILVPANLPVGDAEFILEVSGIPYWTTVPIVSANFSLFRSGTPGPLLAQNIAADGSASPNGLANPAQPGQYVTLWATGGLAAPNAAPAAQVTLGGIAQRVVFAGPAPGQVGLIQVNFQITGAVPDSCYAPLAVTYGAQTVSSFLSKTSDGSPCLHPFGLPAGALQILDSGGALQIITTSLNTAINAASADHAFRSESAAVSPNSLSASELASYFVPGNSAVPACTASAGGYAGGYGAQSSQGNVTLNNGSATLSIGPNGYVENVPPSGDAPLASLPPPAISAGAWTWETSGGLGLATGLFSFTLPPPIQLKMGSPVSLARNQNQTILWDPAGYDATALVQVNVVQQTASPDGSQPSISCQTAAQIGSLTIPSQLLGTFAGGAFGYLSATVTESGAGIPHANLLSAGRAATPVLALILWNSSDTRPVDFQ